MIFSKEVLIGLLLTVLPISELRGGLPFIVKFVTENNLPLWPYFLLVILLNSLVIFFIFFFLDFLHEHFMKIGLYKRFMDKYLERIEIKSREIAKKEGIWTYVALCVFVGIPLPLTGAWTGTLIAWFLGLDRKKSIIAIALGVLIAGIIILALSLGFFKLLEIFY